MVQSATNQATAALRVGILCQGQGTQKPGMFKTLLTSENVAVRQAAGEVLEGLLKQIKPEIFDIYYDEGADAAKINSTVNVQPALTAATLIWHFPQCSWQDLME